jgi:hypothetical protein
MTRYRLEEAINGRWSRDIHPVMRHKKPYKMSCCDCGVVHDIEFWIDTWPDGSDHVAMRVARNNRATGQVRRHRRAAAE